VTNFVLFFVSKLFFSSISRVYESEIKFASLDKFVLFLFSSLVEPLVGNFRHADEKKGVDCRKITLDFSSLFNVTFIPSYALVFIFVESLQKLTIHSFYTAAV
jgi:hypothetical protein